MSWLVVLGGTGPCGQVPFVSVSCRLKEIYTQLYTQFLENSWTASCKTTILRELAGLSIASISQDLIGEFQQRSVAAEANGDGSMRNEPLLLHHMEIEN